MPRQCGSCGEVAVIQAEIEGEGTKEICIECGTVDNRLGSKETPGFDSSVDPVINESVCESCGVPVASSALQAQLQLCSECQALEENDEDEATPYQAGDPKNDERRILDDTSTCLSCGSQDMSKDCIGTDERWVCRVCGSVVDGDSLISSDHEYGGLRAPGNTFLTLPRYAQPQKKLKGLVAGLNKISLLHDKFCFPDSVKTEANEMFTKAFYEKDIFSAYIITKEHIAAACLFIACRRHNMPISLTHFMPYLEKFSAFFKGKNLVVKLLKIEMPALTLTGQVGFCLEGKGFDAKIVAKVKDILFLCRQAWLTEGRTREGLIAIAAYFAFVGSHGAHGSMSLQKFRTTFNFPAISKCLFDDCRNLFLKLARVLPWADQVNSKNLYCYIDDILQYRNSVFQLAFTTDKPDKIPSQVACKRKQSNSSKELLLPSALKRKKITNPPEEVKIPSHVDLYDPEVRDTDFDDDEINSYLLTEEEQDKVKHLKIQCMKSEPRK